MKNNSPAPVISGTAFIFRDWLAVATGSASFSTSSHACLLRELLVDHLVHTRFGSWTMSIPFHEIAREKQHTRVTLGTETLLSLVAVEVPLGTLGHAQCFGFRHFVPRYEI